MHAYKFKEDIQHNKLVVGKLCTSPIRMVSTADEMNSQVFL